MANGDKRVSDLPAASVVLDDDRFVLEQNGEPKSLSGAVLISELMEALQGHGGIKSWKLTSSVGIVDTYTITFVDGHTEHLNITNGAKGEKGDPGHVWIKYASKVPTEESHSMGDIPDQYIGIYSGNDAMAPADWKLYTWYQWKGYQGETGEKGDRGKSIFYSSSETQAKEDTQFIPSLIETNGETLRIGDMILVPAGNLFQITRLPTDAEYVIHARYLTSLVGPEGADGASAEYGIAFYRTTTEPPDELTDRIYSFDLDTISTRGNKLRFGDYIIDGDYNLFRIEGIGPTSLRASWVTTWSQKAAGLPEYFDYIVLRSSTENSYKRFKVSVDDSGTLTTTEIINLGTVTFRDYIFCGGYEGELSFVIGMTWSEFCDSEYNTQNFSVSDHNVNDPSGCYLLYETGVGSYMSVAPNDRIVNGREYLWDMM